MTAYPILLAVLVATPPDFDRDVQPILATHCVSCHGPTKQKGGLRLDRRADALRGGDSGAAIVPGDAVKSLLLTKVRNDDSSTRMPPTGEPLSASQIRLLTAWIAAGAKWPEQTEGVPTASHWSFQPLKRPTLPTFDRVEHPIDRFLQTKLADAGLKPNPPADRRTLLRRLKFDLIGLPPTPEEVAAFEADRSPRAYELLVDRYLASPQYGERWARHWLDVVRFADSHGFEMNQPRPTAWHYRDWVIRSLNEDKPYDRFVFEQLAGDTIGADAATGFLVAGPWDQVKSPDIALTRQQRADELHDIVATTGSAFLGLTVGCARCHAHKFDPVSQADYYRIKAVFAGVQHGEREVRNGDPIAKAKQIDDAKAELAALETQLANLEPLADPGATEVRRTPINPKRNVERFASTRAKFVRFVACSTNSAEPCLDEVEVFTIGPNARNVALATAGATARSSGDYPVSNLHQLKFLNDGRYGNGRSWISNQVGRGRVVLELTEPFEIDRIVWSRDREGKYLDRLATRYRIDVSLDSVAWQVVASSDDRATTDTPTPPGLNAADRARWAKLTEQIAIAEERLTKLSRQDMAYAGRFAAPEPTHRLHRGDPMAAREEIAPGVLGEIGPRLGIAPDATDSQRRAALAKWITDPANPLTARVIVNRLWQHHFGVGLVETPSDFGRNGAKPTNPELLDWLAAELIEAKWSLKHLQRIIVTSHAYRQSSAATPDGLAKDAQSRLLWRFPRQRLEAEVIRDSILFVSRKLDLTMGGPGFDLFEPNTNYVRVYTPRTTFGPAEFRRMVYQQKPRMQLDDTFGAFDCPDGGQIAPRRNVSTTPLQALNLLNSPFLTQQSKFLADRVEVDAKTNVASQVNRVFSLAFQRSPSDAELAAAVRLVKEHGLPALARAVLNANEFLYVD